MTSKFVAVLGCCLAALVAAGCGSSDKAATGGGGKLDVQIGLVDSFTGPAAGTAVAHQRGAELAAQQINATSKNVHVELVTKNDKGTPRDGVAAVQSLLSDKSIDALTGVSLSSTGVAMLPLVASDGRPSVFMQLATLPSRSDNVLSLAPSRGPLATMTIDKVVAPKGIKSVGLIWMQNPVLEADAQAFRDALKKHGIPVVADQGASQTTSDFSSQITAVLSKNPDAIGLTCLPAASGTIVSQLRARGYKGMIFGQQAMDSEPFRKVAGGSAEGVDIFTFWDAAAANDQAKRFLSLYKQKYPNAPAPDVFTAQGWDAVQAIAQAAERAGSTDKDKLNAALKAAPFDGVEQEQIGFGSDGFAKLTGYVVQLKGDSAEVLAQ